MFGFFSVRLYSIFSLKVKTKKDNKERGKIINYLVTISVKKKNISRNEKKAGKEKKKKRTSKEWSECFDTSNKRLYNCVLLDISKDELSRLKTYSGES